MSCLMEGRKVHCNAETRNRKKLAENRKAWDGPSEGKNSKRWKGYASWELLTQSSPDHQSVTSPTRLGLGHHVLLAKKWGSVCRSQNRGGESGEVVETVRSVYCSNSPFPLCDHNTNDAIPSQTIHHNLTASHAAFLQKSARIYLRVNTKVIAVWFVVRYFGQGIYSQGLPSISQVIKLKYILFIEIIKRCNILFP